MNMYVCYNTCIWLCYFIHIPNIYSIHAIFMCIYTVNILSVGVHAARACVCVRIM